MTTATDALRQATNGRLSAGDRMEPVEEFPFAPEQLAAA